MNLQSIKIAECLPSATNTKGRTEGKEFDELVASIKEKGVLQPVLARAIDQTYQKGTRIGKWEIIAGNRRLLAADKAGLKEIPSNIVEMTDDEAREAQIVENLQRADIHPLDEAAALIALVREIKDVAAVAAKIGKSAAYVKARIQLANLDKEVAKEYRAGKMNDGQAAEVANLSPGGDQQKALTHIKQEQSYGGRILCITDLKRDGHDIEKLQEGKVCSYRLKPVAPMPAPTPRETVAVGQVSFLGARGY